MIAKKDIEDIDILFLTVFLVYPYKGTEDGLKLSFEYPMPAKIYKLSSLFLATIAISEYMLMFAGTVSSFQFH